MTQNMNKINLAPCSFFPSYFWLLIEFCEKGDLKNYLLKHREDFKKAPKKEEANKSRLLLTWAFDIAKGMEYLASKNVMHGDLAARNILIGRGKFVSNNLDYFKFSKRDYNSEVSSINNVITYLSFLKDKEEMAYRN